MRDLSSSQVSLQMAPSWAGVSMHQRIGMLHTGWIDGLRLQQGEVLDPALGVKLQAALQAGCRVAEKQPSGKGPGDT